MHLRARRLVGHRCEQTRAIGGRQLRAVLAHGTGRLGIVHYLLQNFVAAQASNSARKTLPNPEPSPFAFKTRNSVARGGVSRTTEFGGGPSRDRHPRSARDIGSSNEGLLRCRAGGPSTSDTERPDPTPRPEAGRRRPRAHLLIEGHERTCLRESGGGRSRVGARLYLPVRNPPASGLQTRMPML